MFLVSSVQNILDILIHGAVVLMLVLSQQVTVIRHLLPLQRFQQQMENIMYNLINQRAYPRATSQQLTITINYRLIVNIKGNYSSYYSDASHRSVVGDSALFLFCSLQQWLYKDIYQASKSYDQRIRSNTDRFLYQGSL